MKRNIYIFRHGETDYNVNKRMQGWLDVPLNKNGIAQAEMLYKKMSNIKMDCVYSSPLSRALDTAKIVVPNTKIITVDGLKEWNLGVFNGKILHITEEPANTPIDMSTDIVNIPLALCSDDNWLPDNGESRNMLRQRVCNTVIDILNNTDAKTIGISTHGGVIKILAKRFTNLNWPRNGIPNAEYLKMQWDGENFTLAETPDWLLK
jgi:probable phosphoglycerate mutase